MSLVTIQHVLEKLFTLFNNYIWTFSLQVDIILIITLKRYVISSDNLNYDEY